MQNVSCFVFPQVHDEVKDKMFELELSWVGEFTGGLHKRVPDNVSWQEADLLDGVFIKIFQVHEEAEKFAKSAMEEDSDDSDEEMSWNINWIVIYFKQEKKLPVSPTKLLMPCLPLQSKKN